MKRVAMVLVAAVVVAVAYSCGETEPPPNRAPRVVAAIPAQQLMIPDTLELDLSQYFDDEDGDELTYRAVTGSPGVAGVAVSGSILRIWGNRGGESAITVIARDPDFLTATQEFVATVRGAPGFLSVQLRYDEEDIGAVVLRLRGPPADSIQAAGDFTIYHARAADGVRAFVAGALPAEGALFRFWAEDASNPGDYEGILEQAAGTDYRQRLVESGSVRVVR